MKDVVTVTGNIEKMFEIGYTFYHDFSRPILIKVREIGQRETMYCPFCDITLDTIRKDSDSRLKFYDDHKGCSAEDRPPNI